MGKKMHIIGALTSIAILVYWIMRAAGSARSSGVIGAWQRRKKWNYSSVNSPSNFDYLETPIDAAAALMVALGRDSLSGELRANPRQKIASILQSAMQMDEDAALEKIKFTEAKLRNMVQADSVAHPAVRLLRDQIDAKDARSLAVMLGEVLELDKDPSPDKLNVITSYKERMGLAH